MISVVLIAVSAVLFRHLGLVEAIEGVLRREFVLIGCPKCLTFWASLAHLLCVEHAVPIMAVFTAFTAAYAAVWLELLFGFMSKVYNKLCDEVYSDEEDEGYTDEDRAEDGVPRLRQGSQKAS